MEVTQIFVCHSITRMSTNGPFQHSLGFIETIQFGVDDSQIVVRLRQFWVVFRQLGECQDGIGNFSRFALNQPFQKSHLRISRFARQKSLSLAQRSLEVRLAQLIDV